MVIYDSKKSGIYIYIYIYIYGQYNYYPNIIYIYIYICSSYHPITRTVAKMEYETEAEPRSSNSILADVRVIG